MGAPPPTTAKVSVTVKINTQRIGVTKRAQMWDDVEKILLAWGSDVGGDGNTENGLKFQLERPSGPPPPPGTPPPPPDAYTVWCEAKNKTQRNRFLGAYKKLREELEALATKNEAHVNEWNDVSYGGRSLRLMFPGNPDETAKPETPVRIPPRKARPTTRKKKRP
jgi:hypothetical protein